MKIFVGMFVKSVPDSNHLLLHAEAVGNVGDLLRGWLRVRVERSLQGQPNGSVNGGPLLPFPAEWFVAGEA